MSKICVFLHNFKNAQLAPLHFWNFTLFADEEGSVSTLNQITYAYIAPVIITIGVIGDVLTVATLTHPLLRRSSIIYTYLTMLAMTDLLTHFSVIPMILWLLDWRLCSPTSAFYYAHIGFPLANALMGASVWIVVFLTLSQYMAVCRPFYQGFLRKRRMCVWLVVLSYAFSFCIYAPWATKKAVHVVPRGLLKCSYVVCDRATLDEWFWFYEWAREFLTRVFPFILIAYFNAMILITYRSTKLDRMRHLTTHETTTATTATRSNQKHNYSHYQNCQNGGKSAQKHPQKRTANERSEQEEKRLFTLLFAIIIVFFLCTIPAAPLTIFVADRRSQNLTFQIFRAVTNLLEFTKFALNFYFYCLINPDIRRICLRIIRCRKLGRPARVKGQPVNPISIYTRSTKSTIRNHNYNGFGGGATTGIGGVTQCWTQNGSSRRDSIRGNSGRHQLRRALTSTSERVSSSRRESKTRGLLMVGRSVAVDGSLRDNKANANYTTSVTLTPDALPPPQKKRSASAMFVRQTPVVAIQSVDDDQVAVTTVECQTLLGLDTDDDAVVETATLDDAVVFTNTRALLAIEASAAEHPPRPASALADPDMTIELGVGEPVVVVDDAMSESALARRARQIRGGGSTLRRQRRTNQDDAEAALRGSHNASKLRRNDVGDTSASSSFAFSPRSLIVAAECYRYVRDDIESQKRTWTLDSCDDAEALTAIARRKRCVAAALHSGAGRSATMASGLGVSECVQHSGDASGGLPLPRQLLAVAARASASSDNAQRCGDTVDDSSPPRQLLAVAAKASASPNNRHRHHYASESAGISTSRSFDDTKRSGATTNCDTATLVPRLSAIALAQSVDQRAASSSPRRSAASSSQNSRTASIVLLSGFRPAGTRSDTTHERDQMVANETGTTDIPQRQMAEEVTVICNDTVPLRGLFTAATHCGGTSGVYYIR